MKTILILLLALRCVAQPSTNHYRHTVRIGAGFVFVGSGDNTGTTFRNEYEYQLKRRLSLAASLNLSQTSKERAGIGSLSYRTIKSFTTLDCNLLFSLIDGKSFKLKTGPGFSAKKQRDNDANVGFSVIQPNVNRQDAVMEVNYLNNSAVNYTIGWTIPIHLELHFNKWNYQLRPSLYSFLDGEINSGISLNVGYRL